MAPISTAITMRIRFYAAICILLSAISVMAQQADPNHGLKHWMTPEEASHRDLIGRGFVETDPPAGIVRNVEEFGPAEGVLVRYPFGIPINLIKEMAEDDTVTTIVGNASNQASVTSQYQSNGVNLAHCKFLIAPTDTYWTRDYGPWYVTYGDKQVGIVDFPYNRPRPNDDDIPKKLATSLGIEWFGMNVIQTGGNYMTDGMGQSASTTLVWEENPGQSHEQIAQKMHDYLGIENYMVVPDPNGTYIDHIDCWGKFLAPDKILIRKVPPTHPQYTLIENTAAFFASSISSYGTPYRVFRVNTPNDEPYTNSFILNKKVFVPIMGNSNDNAALLAYQTAMPGYEILGYLANPSAPWESTDALHCRTHEMADRGMLYIKHMPLLGQVTAQADFEINADIVPFSKQPVYSDSAWVIYKVNSGAWDTLSMVNSAGDHWTASIPGQMEGDTVSYFITAADASGRRQNHPFIGAPDPHVFIIQVFSPPDVTVAPDTLQFETWEDMYHGKKALVRNYSSQPVTINRINTQGTDPFGWYIDPWNIEPPFILNSGDSLILNVKIDLQAGKTDIRCDTLQVSTDASVHNVFLCLDLDLLTGINPGDGTSSEPEVFPNPVQTTATVGFSIEKAGRVKIDVISGTGQVAATIADNNFSKGKHSLTWNAQKLPSGIYLVRFDDGHTVGYTKVLVNR